MMTEKVATPREGLSVRSGMNSERRKYEKKHKHNYSDNESDHYDFDKSSSHSRDLTQNHEYPPRIANDLDQKDIDDMIEKFGNKEIDLTRQNKNNLEKSDNEGLISVETPKIASDDNSAFDMTNKVFLGPQNTEGDSSQDSKDDILKDKRPISLDVNTKNVSADSKEDDKLEVGVHSLSRKKSEHRLTEIETKLPKDLTNKIKSTITPTPQSKPNILNQFNSDHFFTQNFDDQEMEAAIEQLKNSSGKMGLPNKGDGTDSVDVLIDHKEFSKRDTDKTPGAPNFPLSGSDSPLNQDIREDRKSSNDKSSDDSSKGDWNNTLGQNNEQKLKDAFVAAKDDYNLIKQVEKNKIVQIKDSRNSDIKESKNKEIGDKDPVEENDQDKYYGVDNDVEFLKKKNTVKPNTEDSRNQKRVTQKSSSSGNESLKEDIILENIDDNQLSDEDKTDPKNITGSQSLDYTQINTPDKNTPLKDSDLENSDSKYATVSILSELNKSKSQDVEPQKDSLEVSTANKLADLIYSAMLAEIKTELFPPRPLFLLTADLDKIELEQAMIYLNDMSVEKEAALLKEYLRYSGSDDIDLDAWDDDKKNDEDGRMFSDSGKLVLYERKGISTDLFSIEHYVDELSDEVDLK